MKKVFVSFLLVWSYFTVFAQKRTSSPVDTYLDIAATFGNSQQSFSGSYVYNWRFGKNKKWEIGSGFRLTSTSGQNLDYLTAGPARLTRGSNFPFLVVASSQKTENWDTLNVQHPFTTSGNLTFNLGYNFSKRLLGGCNIDVVGFTLGNNSKGIFTHNGISSIESVAKPTAFNLLLTGDNDLGSLNSEFFLKYLINNRWGIRGVYQFLFTEYKTNTLHQTTSDGTVINRFRNKANNFGVGVSYRL